VLPLAWFYLALVVFLYSLLLFVELRNRAKRHVKGCPSLPYISPEGLDSLLVIEPDVIVVELSSRTASSEIPKIPDALRMPVSQLQGFLRKRLVARFSFSMIPPRSPCSGLAWNALSMTMQFLTSPFSKEVSNCG
jgi:hypothetical protein